MVVIDEMLFPFQLLKNCIVYLWRTTSSMVGGFPLEAWRTRSLGLEPVTSHAKTAKWQSMINLKLWAKLCRPMCVNKYLCNALIHTFHLFSQVCEWDVNDLPRLQLVLIPDPWNYNDHCPIMLQHYCVTSPCRTRGAEDTQM